MTAAFTSANPSSSGITISFTAASYTPSGAYQFVLGGTSGSHLNSATITVNVTRTAEFSVFATPSALIIAQGGGGATSTISVNGAYNSSVTLSYSGLPVGSSAVLSPSILPGSGATALSITTTAGMSQGTYPFTVTATGAGQTRSTYLTLDIAAPGPATMISPAPGSFLTSSTMTFSWDAGVGALQYELLLGSTPGASDFLSANTGSARSVTANLPGPQQSVYATLRSFISGSWLSQTYTYQTASPLAGPGSVTKASKTGAPPAATENRDLPNSLEETVTGPWYPSYDVGSVSYPISGAYATACTLKDSSPNGGNVQGYLSSPSEFDPSDWSSFDITFYVPSTVLPGDKDITCTIAGQSGRSVTNAVHVNDATPQIDSVSPPTIDAISDPFYITLYGTNFGPNPGSVSICSPGVDPCNGTPDIALSMTGPFTYWSDTQINIILIPAQNASGPYDLVVNSGGESGSGFQSRKGNSSKSAPGQLVVKPVSPVLIVSVNGQQIKAGSTVYVDPQDPPLHITANLLNASGGVTWQLHAQYRDSRDTNGYDTYVPFGPLQQVPAGTAWETASSIGGTITVMWTLNTNPTNSAFQFYVKGTNPSPAAVRSYMGNTPWFFQRIPMAESSQPYAQFTSARNPLWGTPHGYGLMQIDPAPSMDVLFNWKTNVDQGRAKNDLNAAASLAWWTKQLQDWSIYNSLNPTQQVPLQADVHEGDLTNGPYCTFTATDTVPNGKFGFRDAVWIKMYNGAASNFISFLSSGSWKINNFNSGSPGVPPFDYVARICQGHP